MAKKNASGSGNIRKRADNRWEARYTYFDELGQPKRGSVYGDTQKECRQKLTAILKKIDEQSFRNVKRYTVEEWMKEWLATYGTTLKPRTFTDYKIRTERYIIPALGKSQLTALTPMQIQRFCNRLTEGYDEQRPLAPKTVKNIHGILHSALKQAVLAGLLTSNPADNTRLPKVKKPELKPLMDDGVTRFLQRIRGDRFERVYFTALFTGLRQSELLGLKWEDVDFEKSEITVCRQLQRPEDGRGYLFLDETKNGKNRTIPVPPSVMETLAEQKKQQTIWAEQAGKAWNNEYDLVFTDELGEHLKHETVYRHFKRLVRSIGLGETRFHDLRHSCAILALQSGCSVKAVQEQLGHFSSAFTMDVYTSLSETMKSDTRNRLEGLIQQVSESENFFDQNDTMTSDL